MSVDSRDSAVIIQAPDGDELFMTPVKRTTDREQPRFLVDFTVLKHSQTLAENIRFQELTREGFQQFDDCVGRLTLAHLSSSAGATCKAENANVDVGVSSGYLVVTFNETQKNFVLPMTEARAFIAKLKEVERKLKS